MLFAFLAVAAGLLLMGLSSALQRREHQDRIEEVLNLRPVVAPHPDSPVVQGAVALAGRMVSRIDAQGGMARGLEMARIPLRPGEYVILTVAAGLALAALMMSISGGAVLAGVAGVLLALGGSMVFVRWRTAKRRRAFEAQLPAALSLIASSLAAGHTFLRAVQMMCEESSPPLSEEFERVVAETRLGDSLVVALERMAGRLNVRDLDWVVQAIRIQQTVGGRLSELLHTLADFIRARDEVRREIRVLTAEGRMSAWVLSGLAPLLLLTMQVMNPDYIEPMYTGTGLIVLGLAAASVGFGAFMIFRMVKIRV